MSRQRVEAHTGTDSMTRFNKVPRLAELEPHWEYSRLSQLASQDLSSSFVPPSSPATGLCNWTIVGFLFATFSFSCLFKTCHCPNKPTFSHNKTGNLQRQPWQKPQAAAFLNKIIKSYSGHIHSALIFKQIPHFLQIRSSKPHFLASHNTM